jgi:hypothetical protein
LPLDARADDELCSRSFLSNTTEEGAEFLWIVFCDQRRDSAKFRSRSHHAVIRVYHAAGNVIETHEHAGEFKE